MGFAWVGVDFSRHGCGDTIGVWAMFRDLRFRILDKGFKDFPFFFF